MPTDFRISELPTSASFDNLDLMEVSQVDAQSLSGYTSVKKTMNQIGDKINNDIQYAADLNTTDKTIIGAINEVNGKGIADLSDTDITTPTANQVLMYDGDNWVNSNRGKIEVLSGTGTTDGNGIVTSTALGIAQLDFDHHIILAVQSSSNGVCVNVGQYNKNFYYVCTAASGLANPIANTSVTLRIAYINVNNI